jgi:type IV pilus assembly protein PilA
MKNITKKSKKGFTLIELVVVIAILGILAAILVPVISGFIETAKQATDNANARLVYQSAAMYYASKNVAADPILATDIQPYLGLTDYPTAGSAAFAGKFSASVTINGVITVTTGKATYNVSTSKLS